jgi:3'-phosphoadenosine 5'-phosphosulfate sulfotransferase (PAPS reductase)/FAD synthetase
MAWRISHLRVFAAESIDIFREVASEFQLVMMLHSLSKDSSVMRRLAIVLDIDRDTITTAAGMIK